MLSLDPYVVDVLLPDLVGHDRRPSAYLVYLVLWRRAHETGAEVSASLQSITESTGLSKRAVQDALEHLSRRRLVTAQRESMTAVARFRVHEPWIERRRRSGAERSA
ncbi:MAG: helix-turn-helix domain-containing protein [Gemmatimonadaceae bacterium]